MSAPHILILGAGVMQIPALRLARAQGWGVAVVDGNPNAAGRDLADTFGHVDLRDRDGLAAWARSYRSRRRLDGVFTAGTDFSASVAWVAEQLGLPGIPFETALDASDKERMRTRFSAAGVPSPPFFSVDNTDDPAAIVRRAEAIGFPVVVKPVDNMGARGVVRIHEPELLHDAVRNALTFSADGRVVVERFIEGPEFSIDAVVYRGEVHICGVADRDIRFPPWFIEIGHTMPTDRDASTRAELERVFIEGVRALGISNGAAKGDVFLSAEGPVIGEIAARLSGGYMSGWTYPFSSGVEPTLAAMRIALGLPPDSLTPIHHHVSVERALLSVPGIVREVHGFDLAREVEGVREVFQRVEAGDRVVFPRNNVEKCGNVISAAPTREEAFSAALAALRLIHIRLEPGVPETEQFLWGSGRPGSSAFYPALEHSTVDPVDPTGSIQVAGDTDYCGRTLGETLASLREGAGYGLLAALPTGSPGRSRFRRAVARGGLQGGRFFLDTIQEDPGARERVCFAS